MKINPLVKLSFQDYGTNILLIMEGKPADNVLQLNSFVNFGGVNFGAHVDYPIDKPDRQIGQFWTTRERVLSYFQFRAFMGAGGGSGDLKNTKIVGKQNAERFLTENREPDRIQFGIVGETYSRGTISAEKLDLSGSEQWVSRGLSS